MTKNLHGAGCDRTKPTPSIFIIISVIIQENCNYIYIRIPHQQTVLTELKYNHSSHMLMTQRLVLNGTP